MRTEICEIGKYGEPTKSAGGTAANYELELTIEIYDGYEAGLPVISLRQRYVYSFSAESISCLCDRAFCLQ